MSGIAGISSAAQTFYLAIAPLALEAAIVGVFLWLVARLGRGTSSNLRYGLLVLAIAKFIVPPVQAPWSVELPQYRPDRPEVEVLSVTDPGGAAPDRDLTTVDWQSPATPLRLDQARETATDDSLRAAGRPGAEPVSTPLRNAHDAALDAPKFDFLTGIELTDFFGVLLLVHLGGALILGARRASQWLAVQRLLRRSRPLEDPELLGLLSAIATRQGLRRLPRVVVSSDGVGPAAVGVVRRAIILPERLVATAKGSELRAVIAHEVAHHRRGDLVVDWIAFLGGLVWWPHPVYALLRRDLVRVREDCCDDTAVLEVGAADRYCQSLLDAAAAVGRKRPALPAVAHGSFSHPLGRRIRRLMHPELKPTARLSTPAGLALVVTAALLVPAATTQGSPSQQDDSTSGTAVQSEGLSTTRSQGAGSGSPVTGPGRGIAGGGQATGVAVVGAGGGLQSRNFTYQIDDNVRWGVDDYVIHMTSAAVDEFVKRGLDRDFVEGLIGTTDRELTMSELRGWVQYGLDSDLPGALEQMGIDRTGVFEVLRLVWGEVDGAYVRSLYAAGLTSLDAEEISRLARYDVDGDYVAGFRDHGYTELDTDDFVRLSRYDVEPGYAGTYRDAGYELSVDDMVRLHRYEVDENAAARLAAAGISELSVDDLVTLSRYEVGDDYIRAMTEDGAITLTTDDLVRLKRYEVDPRMASELRDLGQAINTDGLVRLSRYNVSLDYVRGLQGLGYSEPSVDDLVTLQRYEVDLDRLRALADAGYDSLPVSDIVRLQRYGVDADFIRGMGSIAGRDFNVDEMVRLKRYEVSVAYVSGMLSAGLDNVSVDDLVRLKRYEVEPEFVQRLRDGGFDNLTVDRIIRLKRADG